MWSIVSSRTAVVPMLRPVVPGRERAGGERAGVAVVHARGHDHAGRQPELLGHRREHLADDRVRCDQGREPVGVDAGHAQQLRRRSSVTPSVRLSHSCAGEHRRLGGADRAGQPEGDEVHHLEPRRGLLVDLGAVVLEVEHVAERQARADGRDAVVLDPRHERVLVALHDREAVVGAARVEVEEQLGHRLAARRRPGTIEEYWLQVPTATTSRRLDGWARGELADGVDHRGPQRPRVLRGGVARPGASGWAGSTGRRACRPRPRARPWRWCCRRRCRACEPPSRNCTGCGP